MKFPLEMFKLPHSIQYEKSVTRAAPFRRIKHALDCIVLNP